MTKPISGETWQDRVYPDHTVTILETTDSKVKYRDPELDREFWEYIDVFTDDFTH